MVIVALGTPQSPTSMPRSLSSRSMGSSVCAAETSTLGTPRMESSSVSQRPICSGSSSSVPMFANSSGPVMYATIALL